MGHAIFLNRNRRESYAMYEELNVSVTLNNNGQPGGITITIIDTSVQSESQFYTLVNNEYGHSFHINRNHTYNISLSDVSGYIPISPVNGITAIGGNTRNLTFNYIKYETCTVNVSTTNSASVIGSIIYLVDVTDSTYNSSYTLSGSIISHTFYIIPPHQYYIYVSDKSGFITPSQTELFTSVSGNNRNVNMVYLSAEKLTVNVSNDFGTSMAGCTIYIIDNDSTYNQSYTLLNGESSHIFYILSNHVYSVSVSSMTGYYSPNPYTDITAVANNNRTLNFQYIKIAIFGYRRNRNTSNPDNRIEYPATLSTPYGSYTIDNYGYNYGYCNTSTGIFNYGSWETLCRKVNRPVMMYDTGVVAYELNASDQSLKATGGNSDISNVDFAGNAMSEFGYLRWISRYQDSTYDYIIFSNVKLDNNFYAYAFYNSDGTSFSNNFYLGMYQIYSTKTGTVSYNSSTIYYYIINDTARSIKYGSYCDSWVNNMPSLSYNMGVVGIPNIVMAYIDDLFTLIIKSDSYYNRMGNAGNNITPEFYQYNGGYPYVTGGVLNIGDTSSKNQFYSLSNYNKIFYIENLYPKGSPINKTYYNSISTNPNWVPHIYMRSSDMIIGIINYSQQSPTKFSVKDKPPWYEYNSSVTISTSSTQRCGLITNEIINEYGYFPIGNGVNANTSYDNTYFCSNMILFPSSIGKENNGFYVKSSATGNYNGAGGQYTYSNIYGNATTNIRSMFFTINAYNLLEQYNTFCGARIFMYGT